MQGVELPEIVLKSVSVLGDRTRKFDILDTNETPTFLDTIKYPGLLGYAPYLVSPEDPKTSELRVRTPKGNDYPADSQELLHEISEKSGRKLTVVRMGRGGYHSMPVSLLSLGSLNELSSKLSAPVDPRRFRMNILVETASNAPYEEESWLGKILTFGDREDSARIVAVKLDKRCTTINMDPKTGEMNPEILKTLVREHGKNFGIYCSIVLEGTVKVGDTIYLSDLG